MGEIQPGMNGLAQENGVSRLSPEGQGWVCISKIQLVRMRKPARGGRTSNYWSVGWLECRGRGGLSGGLKERSCKRTTVWTRII